MGNILNIIMELSLGFRYSLALVRGAIMSKRDAYLFYEAGQAVAAAHLGLTIRHVSGNPALLASEIVFPRNQPKARMILWLTGMAAEKKAVGRSDPLRRTRNRLRLRSLLESVSAEMVGPAARRRADARTLVNQAQDRANAICNGLYLAINQVAALLSENESITGEQVKAVVDAIKAQRSRDAAPPVDPFQVSENKQDM